MIPYNRLYKKIAKTQRKNFIQFTFFERRSVRLPQKNY